MKFEAIIECLFYAKFVLDRFRPEPSFLIDLFTFDVRFDFLWAISISGIQRLSPLLE